jgi:hypothetical protein
LVIVDTLAMFKPRAKGRRTQYDEDSDVVDPLTPIAANHNVAIVLVHHLREAESDDPLDMIHGSAGLTGGVDGALVLKRKRGHADAYLHVDGRDIENPAELALKWDADAVSWTVMGGAEEYRRSETRRKILTVLEEADEPLGAKDIAELTDLPENTVRQRLYQMSKDGEVKVVARGRCIPHNFHNKRNNGDTHVTDVTDVTVVKREARMRGRPHALALMGEPPGDQDTFLGPAGTNRDKRRVQEQRRQLDVVEVAALERLEALPELLADT